MNRINNNIPVNIKRGDIYNVIQPENNLPTGSEMWANRPAVIISNNATNEKSNIVNVVFLTTKPKRPMPYHITVTSGNRQATAMCEQIFTVDKSRLTYKVGTVTDNEMSNIDKAILFALGISNTVHPSSLFSKWINYIDKHGVILSENSENEVMCYESEIARLKKEICAYKTLLHDRI